MGGTIKRIWTRLILLVAGGLALLGIQPSWAALTPPAQHIGEVKENTPLYLKLGIDQKVQGEGDIQLTGWRHYQHFSHHAHRSHWAHYSHGAHYSHYNYYR